MARLPREKSSCGFYHIMFRGVNHQNIFEEKADYAYLTDIIIKLRLEMGFEIHAYCFMSNHVHLLLKEANDDVSLVMKRILVRYAMYFNKKYERSGALIANRYNSKVVPNEKYALAVLTYIHLNPVRAGIVNRPDDYAYSSYREYLYAPILARTDFILGIIDLKEFIEQHKLNQKDIFVGTHERTVNKMKDEEIYISIKRIINGKNPLEIDSWEKSRRNEMIVKLRRTGFSIRQIERATGISRGIIARCK